MTDQTTASVPEASSPIAELTAQLYSGSEKKQLQLIPELANAGTGGLAVLMDFLTEQASAPPNLSTGFAYQILYQTDLPKVQDFLKTHFPKGIVPLGSEAGIDYTPLQQLLVKQDFLAADNHTLEKLCQLAGPTAMQRKWLYFSEVEKFPITDLQTINSLWFIHSQGKFGYSVQREIWLSLGKNWEKLWSKIGWKTGNNWTRYPKEFTWELSAPKGHLPLSNQLRGVRVIASLLSHPAWSN
ncbi:MULTISPECIES: GUN4 domain-containing protein [unclassified Coleofasciculus]|uniref:GUN4 domain-containing protein n=1 Tax=unclassified Coleofasciculus TaxID=2692782 RepID=UPI00187F6B13|nr:MULTISPECIES: GUN4 domain-containing protein [unclassified Coleofasciculus]MBE9124652.1 GUN4 domain-containing protein [Coleofasciculus sp. LEGE 07081]MBE9146979.1 GUN4 domain-containing protein [Coleofasciculus sp. LEGE 07092]